MTSDPQRMTSAAMAAPPSQGGTLRRAVRWMRRNLFSSIPSTLVTLGFGYLIWRFVAPFIEWAVLNASVGGTSRAECAEGGACWSFVSYWIGPLFYGRYPVDARWRIDTAAVLLALVLVPVMVERLRLRLAGLVTLFLIYPPVAVMLIVGGVFGLPPVDAALLGGLTLNIVMAFVAGAASLPLGIILALARRSKLPLVRVSAVAFIEFWRGVPLITVLFTALVLLPLFLPEHWGITPLLRAMVALTLFYAAYMAEIVRSGLQALPRGQTEAAQALGLGYWRIQLLVVLPQALRLVIPGLVNTLIELFKDSTLVYVIGLFDVLGVVSLALRDMAWVGAAREAYLFVAAVYFVCCFAMSRYSLSLERRLDRGRR